MPTLSTAAKTYSAYPNGVRVVRYRPERWAEYRSYAVEVFTETGNWEDAYHCPWDYLCNARAAARLLSEKRNLQ